MIVCRYDIEGSKRLTTLFRDSKIIDIESIKEEIVPRRAVKIRMFNSDDAD